MSRSVLINFFCLLFFLNSSTALAYEYPRKVVQAEIQRILMEQLSNKKTHAVNFYSADIKSIDSNSVKINEVNPIGQLFKSGDPYILNFSGTIKAPGSKREESFAATCEIEVFNDQKRTLDRVIFSNSDSSNCDIEIIYTHYKWGLFGLERATQVIEGFELFSSYIEPYLFISALLE